jgi:hypothetical protein
MVQRSVVCGRVDAVKTEYSKDYVPLDPRLEGLLLEWRTFSAYSSDADWVFANPQTGKPYHQESLKKRQLLGSPTSSVCQKGSVGIRSPHLSLVAL